MKINLKDYKIAVFGAFENQVVIEGYRNKKYEYLAHRNISDDPAVIIFSDGTVIAVELVGGKKLKWNILILSKGDLFHEKKESVLCNSNEFPTDIVIVNQGVQWIKFIY